MQQGGGNIKVSFIVPTWISIPHPTLSHSHSTPTQLYSTPFPRITLPSLTMPFQSRLASFGALDRFDNGAGIFSLPLEYHDLFRFVHCLSENLPVTLLYDEDGREFVRADPFAVESLARLINDLLLRIGAASYGGVLPQGDSFPLFRNGSFDEIGLVSPPLLHFLHPSAGLLPFRNVLPAQEHHICVDELMIAINDTREWLATAQRRTMLLSPFVGWRWANPRHLASDVQVSSAGSQTLRMSADDLESQISPAPSLVWPLGLGPEFVGAVRVYLTTEAIEEDSDSDANDSDSDDGASNGDSEDGATDDDSEKMYSTASDAASVAVLPPLSPSLPLAPLPAPPGLSTALIPHPIYGPGAQNAVVPYNPWTSLPTFDSTTGPSPSTALIPHPIYGPNAQNSLVLYRAPVQDFPTEPSAPPNSRASTSTPPPPYSEEPMDDEDDDDDDECIEVRRGDVREWPIYVGSDDEEEFED